MSDKSKPADFSVELSGREAFALAQSAELVLGLLGERQVSAALPDTQWALLVAIEREEPGAVFPRLARRPTCAAA